MKKRSAREALVENGSGFSRQKADSKREALCEVVYTSRWVFKVEREEREEWQRFLRGGDWFLQGFPVGSQSVVYWNLQ